MHIEKNHPKVTQRNLVMPDSDPEGRMFLYAPNIRDRNFCLHAFLFPVFDVNLNDSKHYTSPILHAADVLHLDSLTSLVMPR